MKIKAYAKINLTLDIIGKREDGYHLLDMLMQTVDLADDIYLEINNSGTVSVKSSMSSLGGEDDIVFKAAKMFFREADLSDGADIFVEKHIPLSAGLGGGSSDAAAVLNALNRYYGDILNEQRLAEIALSLGADVPFFIKGGTQRARGIGEQLSEVAPLNDCYIVLAKQATKNSTGQMYALIDSMNNLLHPDVDFVEAKLNANDLKAATSGMINVFSAAYNISDELNAAYCDNNSLCFTLSGSGPTFFGIFSEYPSAESCLNKLKRANIEAYLVKPVSVGFSVE